jgi:hypothetical protein
MLVGGGGGGGGGGVREQEHVSVCLCLPESTVTCHRVASVPHPSDR